MEKLIPAVVFTSEFDIMRRDALHLIEKLKKLGTYVDHQDIPGVHHMYQIIGDLPETQWFFDEFADAFDFYIRGQKDL